MIWRSLTFIGLGLTSGILGMWVAEREPPITIESVEVLTTRVRAGEDFKARFHVTRRKLCAVRVERMLVDGESGRHPLATTDLSGPPGPLGHDSYVSLVSVPEKAAPGHARYRANAIYRCNPLHGLWPIVDVGQDLEFEILPAELRTGQSHVHD